ncbi:MAG: SIS domain-containing protein [Deltaproteobacteria bacterium]|nr:SIS domain-containing protein [Deltaproteobacteria bacterium]
MGMIFRITAFLLEALGITGIYFGRAIHTLPPGSLVFFPYDPHALSCGITGILAFKGPIAPSNTEACIGDLEAKVSALCEHLDSGPIPQQTGADAQDAIKLQIIEKAKQLCRRLKSPPVFYDIFCRRSDRDRIRDLCDRLDRLIKEQRELLNDKKGRISPEQYRRQGLRLVMLADVAWALRHEFLDNIHKVATLGSMSGSKPGPQAVALLREINAIFNNLDRLEVRGRDSAGISVLFGLDQEVFSGFRETLRKADLDKTFEERASGTILANKSIRVNQNAPESMVSVAFTYKVAAEVGALGDNVRYLRQEVARDAIFHHLIALPHQYHSAIAHTRWASVGEISEANCHPLDNGTGTGSAGIIHACLNGDIDNYHTLRQTLEKETGEKIPDPITTDTKIIPLLVEKYLTHTKDVAEAFRLAVGDFEGSHAICMHTDLAPGKIFLAQKGSGQAIFVGLAQAHYVAASETYGFVEETSQYLKLDGEKIVDHGSTATQGQIFILDARSSGGPAGIRAMYYDGTPIELCDQDIKETEITTRDIDRRQYSHYFLKEISESPRSVEQTIQGRLAVVESEEEPCPQVLLEDRVIGERLESALRQNRIRKIFFIGQGTAAVAASGCTMLLRDYLSATRIRVASFKASEFSGFMLEDHMDDTLLVAISQSGTTTDTNRAMDMARNLGAHTLAIVNRRDSDITFKVDGVLYTSTGRDIEMSVASTKAYYSQIVAGAVLGLKIAQLTGAKPDAFILSQIEHLWKLPSLMRQVLEKADEIRASAQRFAVTRTYWAIVGSGPNKVSADEIRIKLSELCYKSISSDVVEDKKHIDLSSEPLIFVCAAGSRGDVVSDIVKDTAIFKAHQAVPIVVATEGERRFEPYADSVIYVPEVEERFSPILNTLAGHLWGYYAALAINEESHYLFDFRNEIQDHIDTATADGLDIHEIVLDKTFREKAARFYRAFKERIKQNRYATAMAIHAASDLVLLLKYLAGRLPIEDFEFDFGVKGTAPNMLNAFFTCIGKIINEMSRPVDAIKHQAKTVTVGTSRIAEKVEGILFEALEHYGFQASQLTTQNILVLKRLQAVVREIKGTTVYRIDGLSILGEPVDESTIAVVTKDGTSRDMVSRVESDTRLRGTKRIIVKNGNVFIGRGKRDNRSILAVPVITSGTRIDRLILFNIGFHTKLDLQKKIDALGGKYQHIRHLVEETSVSWQDTYLDMLAVEDLFGMSAEKVSERIVAGLTNSVPVT